jgi:hypothetical protein
MFGVQMQSKLAPEIKKRYGQNHSYCDVHTAVTPFDRVDYDARVPGAGTFRQVFECYGRLLNNEKHVYGGPVCSEGHNHWWFAGLTDMNYAQLSSPAGPREPLFVDFDLLKIHPLEMDAAMGAPSMFFQGVAVDHDQYIATSLAYGHIGYLGNPGNEPDEAADMKMYYMVQPLQQHYTMVPVARIAYDHEGQLLATSQALVSGAYKKSRVFVEYENGFRVWVNGSQQPWSVSALGANFELSRWGYVGASADGNTYSYSAQSESSTGEGSRRIDIAHGPQSHYMDARGAFARTDNLATDGAGALKHESTGWELIPARGFTEFGFDPDLVGIADHDISVEPVPLGSAEPIAPEVRWSRGMVYVVPSPGSDAKFRLRRGSNLPPAAVACDSLLAAVGEVITARLPVGIQVDEGSVAWVLGSTHLTASCSVVGRRLMATVPRDLATGEHLWLRISTDLGPYWLDFVSATP